MINKKVLIGLLLLGTFMSASAAELTVGFKAGKPTQKEFILAAKRTFFKRNYEISAVSTNKVTGVYKSWMSMDLILTDGAVIIRNTEPANNDTRKIKGYLNNLSRDLTYELAEYML